MLQQGVHPKVVQERLGHSDISLTLNTYSHVVPGMQEEAAGKLDELLEPINVSDELRKLGSHNQSNNPPREKFFRFFGCSTVAVLKKDSTRWSPFYAHIWGTAITFFPYLGATSRLRPDDLIITNYLLYQLSYGGLDFTAAGL